MEWLWIIQAGVNLGFLLTLFVWWKERSAGNASALEQKTAALQSQAHEWERDVAILRKKSEDQLRFLVQLCEQAHTILLRHQNSDFSAPASYEEEELRALRNPPLSSEANRAIPSVTELEARKLAVRPEIPLDLRSLLRDQLT